MKAIRFLNTAEKLKDSTPEEDARTSINRSYYAIIHLVRERLGKEKIEINRTQTHLLHNIFFMCNNRNVRAIGAQISTLHDARIHADYKLNRNVQQGFAQTNYDIACKAKEDITLAFNGPEKEDIVKQARIYLNARTN